MTRPVRVDLFAEDMAHEDFLVPLIHRIARQECREVDVHVGSVRGGRAVVLAELALYQRVRRGRPGQEVPDLLVVAIDANCASFAAARNEILQVLQPDLRDRAAAACPDPHIERWYLADLQAFHSVLGIRPSVPRGKCERGFYKRILAKAVLDSDRPPMLGGVPFARDLVQAMDLFRAGREESSFRHFVDELSGCLRLL